MSNFDAKKVKNEIVLWIRDWFEENGKNCRCVLGVSGGKDSSVVAALAVEALGKDRVLGVLMPQGRQSDIDYRNLLGGLYRENPVKSRNYEAVKSSKKWENVGNSYIIPALLLYRYSYI